MFFTDNSDVNFYIYDTFYKIVTNCGTNCVDEFVVKLWSLLVRPVQNIIF